MSFALRCPEAQGQCDGPDQCRLSGHYCVLDTLSMAECEVYNEYLAERLSVVPDRQRELAPVS